MENIFNCREITHPLYRCAFAAGITGSATLESSKDSKTDRRNCRHGFTANQKTFGLEL